MEIKVKSDKYRLFVFPLGMIDTNGYILVDNSGDAVIIDPSTDSETVSAIFHREGWKLRAVINTHGHWDHVIADQALCDEFGAKLYIHEADLPMLEPQIMNIYGRRLEVPETKPDVLLRDGDEIRMNELVFKVIHTPGHTRGGVCLLIDDLLFSGDTLFERSVGRTDLEGGSFDDIIRSIKEKLYVLPPNTIVFPGHGDSTTIEMEKERNPYTK